VAGQGVYTWNDYNNNGIQELQEFEVAPLLIKHKYKSVLPNRIFIKPIKINFLNPLRGTLQYGKTIKDLEFLLILQPNYILLDRKVKTMEQILN
jgi:hypothetical protein